MGLNRRELLLVAGGATIVALGAEAARRVWAQIAADVPPAASLEARHVAIITTLASLILPTTETPGALDVGVPAWVAYVLSESFDAAERQRLLGSLDAIDERARAEFGRGIADLAPEQLESLIEPLDRRGSFEQFTDRAARVLARRVPADGNLGDIVARFGHERHGFQQIKSLIVHGYFTSELVQRDLLKVHWA
jgi:gluconate 2-dehydrogenase gamma chain